MANKLGNRSDPRFMILQADPGKYINTPSSTAVIVIRAIEGIAAVIFLMDEAIGLFSGFISGKADGVFTLMGLLRPSALANGTGFSLMDALTGVAIGLLPPELQSIVAESGASGQTLIDTLQSLLPSSEIDVESVMAAGKVENLLCAAAVAALAAVLAAVFAEAIALIFMRIAGAGSAAAKIAQKVIFYAYIAILALIILINGIFINKCRTIGLAGTLFRGELRSIGLMMILLLVFLTIRTAYHWDAAKVLAAVDFEIRNDFKETALDVKRLPACALIFAFLFALAAAIIVVRTGFSFPAALAAMALLSVKYIMVYSSWTNFRRCHM